MSYDVTYSFTTQVDANDGSWTYWSTQAGAHDAQVENTATYWCWTNTGSTSSGTGPPSGVPCLYPETSSPTAVSNEFTVTLTTALDASVNNFFVTFDRCMQGNSAGYLYFEAYNGSTWDEIASWPGDSTTTFTSVGPYDLTSYSNTDFKVRFRVIVGGTAYQNDFAVDEVRIYTVTEYVISGVTKDKNGSILGSCEVTLFKADTASPPSYIQIAKTTSNATTGAYSFTVYDQDAQYMVYSIKDNTPHVFDATDNVLQPV